MLESPWKQSLSTTARELYDSAQETDSQLQRANAIGRNQSHGKIIRCKPLNGYAICINAWTHAGVESRGCYF